MLKLLSTFWCSQDEVHRRLVGNQDPLPSASYKCLHYPCLPTDTKATTPQLSCPLMPIMMAGHALAHLILQMTQHGSSFKSILDLAVKGCYQIGFSCLPFVGIKSAARGVSLTMTLWSKRKPKIQCPSRRGHFSYGGTHSDWLFSYTGLHSVATQCGAVRTQLYKSR